jgi:hypothetical protein
MIEQVAQRETTSTTAKAGAGLRLQATQGQADHGHDDHQSIHQSTLPSKPFTGKCRP